MPPLLVTNTQTKKLDFFVSRTGTDAAWAQWVAWQLEAKGYKVVVQDWDFGPGVNFVHKMQQAATEAERTIAILSPRYFQSPYTEAEWTVAFCRDPGGEEGRLLPIRIEEFSPPGLFATRNYLDLFDLDSDKARTLFWEWIARVGKLRVKPEWEPVLPSSPKYKKPVGVTKSEPRYPGQIAPLFNLPAQNRNFTGREALLKKLRNELACGRAAALTAPTHGVATFGLGGIGKSQLAIEYAWRWASDYSRVIWLRAETQEALGADFDALANHLELFKSSKPAERPAVIEAVRRYLTENPGWLLILDNAPRPEAVEHVVPRAGGHVIYTSRFNVWAKHAVPVPVNIWPSAEAEQFLLQRVGTKREKQDAPERVAAAGLAKELGCLPLALEHVAAYCEASSFTLADYLPLFQESRLKLFSPEALGGSQDGLEMITVTTTWNLSIEKIRYDEKCPEAAALFTLCAFFGPDRIPLEMIRAGVSHLPERFFGAVLDDLKMNNALKALLRYSLVTVEGSGKVRVLSIHRLLQEVTRERLPDVDKTLWVAAALRMVDQAFPGNAFDVSAWPTCGRLAPHAISILDYAEPRETARLLDHLACYSFGRADYSSAEPLFQRALAIRENAPGPHHPDTATSLNNLAELYRSLARYREAIPLYRRALEIREKTLGPDHRDTLATRSNTAEWTGQNGNAREALGLLRELLLDRKRVLGPDHPDSLATRNSIAFWTGETGLAREALRLLNDLLPDRKRVLGIYHPDTLETRYNMALWTGRKGQAREALGLSRELLPDQQRVLGRDHPDSLMTRGLIASWTGEAGQPREALRLFQELLPDIERVLGPDHSDRLITRNSIADWTGETGDASEALRLFRELLPERERVLGKDHPDTLTTRNNIAAWTGEMGEHREALGLFRELLPDRERILGLDHPGTLKTRGHIAHWTGQMGEPRQALRLFKELLPDLDRVLGKEHPDKFTTLGHIAHWAGQMGEAGEALRMLQELLPDLQSVLGMDHPDTLKTRAHIAFWTGESGQPYEALRLFQELLPDRHRLLGTDHPDTLRTRAHVAFWTERTGQPQEAIRLFQELLLDWVRVLGMNHPDTLGTANNIDTIKRTNGLALLSVPEIPGSPSRNQALRVSS
jgi:tetratricopeptide (TPR) repeat protein